MTLRIVDRPERRPLFAVRTSTVEGEALVNLAQGLAMRREYAQLTDSELLRLAHKILSGGENGIK